MKTRIITALVGLPVLIYVLLWAPLWLFGIVMGIICAIAAYEMLHMALGKTPRRLYVSVMLSAFYPDYIQGEDGMPQTASPQMNNPAYLYRLYYQNELLGMNILKADEAITVDAYTIIFTDPRSYTLIQIKRDPFTPIAALGALIVMIALILAFYLRTAEAGAVQKEDGTWKVFGYSRKGGAEFAGMLKEKQKELERDSGQEAR